MKEITVGRGPRKDEFAGDVPDTDLERIRPPFGEGRGSFISRARESQTEARPLLDVLVIRREEGSLENALHKS